MGKMVAFSVALVLFAFSTTSLGRHHSISIKVDRKNPVTLQGTVRQFLLENPHARLVVDVKDANGKITTWTIEGGPVRGFVFMGFTEATLPPGQAVTVVAYPVVGGGLTGQLFSITLPDGKKYGGGPALLP